MKENVWFYVRHIGLAHAANVNISLQKKMEEEQVPKEEKPQVDSPTDDTEVGLDLLLA